MTTKTKLTADFEFERETKGAVRYVEVGVPEGQEPLIGLLYFRKARFPGKPAKLSVIVEVEA